MTVSGITVRKQRFPRETLAAKKLRWFHAGAQDLAAAMPGLNAQLGPEHPPIYACPLCATPDRIMTFPEASLRVGALTAEHVPPEHVGGRRLALTCKACNNTAGGKMDAAAAEVEKGRAFLLGKGGEARGRVKVGDCELNGRLTWTGETTVFKASGAHPAIVSGFSNALSGMTPGGTISLNFQVKTHTDRLARASWLKSAYLALFALFGYRYALNPALAAVRRQIQDPLAEHIPHFLVLLPGDRPFSECRAFLIRDTVLPLSWGVQLGPYLVFLPGDDSGELYARIAHLRSQNASFNFVSTDAVWPTQPLFGWAHRFKRRDEVPRPQRPR